MSPTAATASAPSRETQKTSTTTKSDSMSISMTIGIASRAIARVDGAGGEVVLAAADRVAERGQNARAAARAGRGRRGCKSVRAKIGGGGAAMVAHEGRQADRGGPFVQRLAHLRKHCRLGGSRPSQAPR